MNSTPLLDTMKRVLAEGKLYGDRTGKGRNRVFGAFERYSLRGNTLPADTTTKLFLKTLTKEILGMIKGSNSIDDLGVAFWEKWAPNEEDIKKRANEETESFRKSFPPDTPDLDKKLEEYREGFFKHYERYIGTIGPMYGVLWRNFPRLARTPMHWVERFEDIPSDKVAKYREQFMAQLLVTQQPELNTKENFERYCLGAFSQTFDQLAKVVKDLKQDPYSSRHRVTAFHPDLIGPTNVSSKDNVLHGFAALAPCHTFFQFMVTDNDHGQRELNCMLYMSSSDVMIGRAYNICQYSMMTIILAHCLGFEPGEFILASCDTHIYNNHLKTPEKEGAEDQVLRQPLDYPTLVLNPAKRDFFDFNLEDIQIHDYVHHPKINYEVAV